MLLECYKYSIESVRADYSSEVVPIQLNVTILKNFRGWTH